MNVYRLLAHVKFSVIYSYLYQLNMYSFRLSDICDYILYDQKNILLQISTEILDNMHVL